jgi:isoleucyl-tRNA synthetase
VHFCDYPTADESLIDTALEERMGIARSVVGLGRKLREDQKLKVRQPLASVTVVSRDPGVTSAARASAALIMEELNVKRVDISSDEAAFCTVSIRPNFQALRDRAGSKLKPIGEALRAWGLAEIGELEGGKALEVDGVSISLADVLLARTPVRGSVVASAGAVTVVLAREFTSILQQARKSAGLEVSDRVRVAFDSSDPEVVAAIERHKESIADEVLAIEFRRLPASAETAELNARPVRYSISKA